MDEQRDASPATDGTLSTFPDGRLAWPIADFCSAVGISRSAWYELQRAGEAPATILIGRRTAVMPDAVRKWLRLRPAAGAPAPRASSPYQENLRAYLEQRHEATMEEILGDCLQLPRERWTRAEKTRVGEQMRALGWTRLRRSVGRQRGYFYARAS